jgi:hypothetical protein
MSTLHNLQYTFQNCVLKPESTASTDWISASGRAAPEIQLSKYSYAYVARLNEVLANDYPAMLVALGDDAFNQLADHYINLHPSHYFSLRDFGCDMPDFVLTHAGENKHWLYELSLFEWMLGDTFDATDDVLFTEQDMAVISPERWSELKFKLHSSVQRIDFEWNTVEMWRALTKDEPSEVSAQRESNNAWLIWREQLVTRFRSLQTDEQLALDKLREGGDFNAVCEALAGLMNEEDVPMHAATLLKGWINQGLISGIN